MEKLPAWKSPGTGWKLALVFTVLALAGCVVFCVLFTNDSSTAASESSSSTMTMKSTGIEVQQSSIMTTIETEMEIMTTQGTEMNSESSTTSQIEDESNSMRGWLDKPEMTTEAITHTSKIIALITESSTISLVSEEEVEKEEESWEDFEWDSSGEVARESTTPLEKSTPVSSNKSSKVTVPPSLLEDNGGDWGDGFDEEWDEGWK
eukprot:GFUD01007488.1.p1 GENE.GFUD01007488.1~~GFUD01007488.1.p1  ORF type:complete len:229 (-),score=74.40 GFUD01007488.1:48-665(-)